MCRNPVDMFYLGWLMWTVIIAKVLMVACLAFIEKSE